MELRNIPIPPIGPDEGLLRVEACGVCGSDRGAFGSTPSSPYIMGHEIVGHIEAIVERAARRLSVEEGDRVLLEEYLPCGQCSWCRSGAYRLCDVTDPYAGKDGLRRYGSMPLSVAPGLWGGYSQYLFLDANTVMHKIQEGISAAVWTMTLPLSNGYQWCRLQGGVEPGQTVVILGPGQQGLGCVVAAASSGAGNLVVVGLQSDELKLANAVKLGATATVMIDPQQGPDKMTNDVREATGGSGADLVVDVGAGNDDSVNLALAIARKGGQVVTVGASGRKLGIDFKKISEKGLLIRGVRGHSYAAVDWAIQAIGSRGSILEPMATDVGLSDLEKEMQAQGSEGPVHVALDPWL